MNKPKPFEKVLIEYNKMSQFWVSSKPIKSCITCGKKMTRTKESLYIWRVKRFCSHNCAEVFSGLKRLMRRSTNVEYMMKNLTREIAADVEEMKR